MKKVINYIEKQYAVNDKANNYRVEKTEYDNSGFSKIIEDNLISIRFAKELKDMNGKVEIRERTSKIYFGKRILTSDYFNSIDNDQLAKLYANVKYVALMPNGSIYPMEYGDKTYEEVLSNLKWGIVRQKKYKIDNKIVYKEEAVDTKDYSYFFEDNLLGFRYIEKAYVELGSKLIPFSNISADNWCYIGERMSLEDVMIKILDDERYMKIYNLMYQNNYKYICKIGRNFIPLTANDMTIEEIINEKKLTK